MLKSIFGRLFGHPIPYHSQLDRRLVKFGKNDYFRATDAVTGVQIFGGTGSGKSSTSGALLADAYMKSGYGGLVLCAQPGEADNWRKIAKRNKRSKDLIVFDDSGDYRFNWIDYARSTIASDGRDMNLVDMISLIGQAAAAQDGKGGGDDNQFFRDNANRLLASALPYLYKAHGTLQLRDLYQFINTAPITREEAQDPNWVRSTFCGQAINAVTDLAMQGDQEAVDIVNNLHDYWTIEFPSMGDRTRGSVVSTLTSTIYPFLHGKLQELFCTTTNIVPEYAREGVIIVLDLPARTHGKVGIVSQQIFKMLFQMAMEAEAVTKKTRPVFIWIDECQFFMNEHDDDHLSVCRKQRVANVFITQDMPTYFARMPDQNRAESLLNKFGTRIFHATTDQRTSSYASDIIGKVDHEKISDTISAADSTSGGDSIGDFYGSGTGSNSRTKTRQQSRSVITDYAIRPNYFGQELRKPTPENGGKSDAIVITNGNKFRSTGSNFVKAEFSWR